MTSLMRNLPFHLCTVERKTSLTICKEKNNLLENQKACQKQGGRSHYVRRQLLTILHVHMVQHGWTISCHFCQTSIDLQILEFHRPQSMKRAIIMKLHYGTTSQFKPAVHGDRKTGNTLHSYHHLLQYLPFTEL